MSKQDVLQKAIEKAVANGWDFENSGVVYSAERPEQVIFNVEFAKALWRGVDLLQEGPNGLRVAQPKYLWQFHLQQMVISGDRIAYLKENM